MNDIEKLLPLLKQRDADVVKACWGIDRNEPLGVIEAAEKFGLTTKKINQILRLALQKIRKANNT